MSCLTSAGQKGPSAATAVVASSLSVTTGDLSAQLPGSLTHQLSAQTDSTTTNSSSSQLLEQQHGPHAGVLARDTLGAAGSFTHSSATDRIINPTFTGVSTFTSFTSFKSAASCQDSPLTALPVPSSSESLKNASDALDRQPTQRCNRTDSHPAHSLSTCAAAPAPAAASVSSGSRYRPGNLLASLLPKARCCSPEDDGKQGSCHQQDCHNHQQEWSNRPAPATAAAAALTPMAAAAAANSTSAPEGSSVLKPPVAAASIVSQSTSCHQQESLGIAFEGSNQSTGDNSSKACSSRSSSSKNAKNNASNSACSNTSSSSSSTYMSDLAAADGCPTAVATIPQRMSGGPSAPTTPSLAPIVSRKATALSAYCDTAALTRYSPAAASGTSTRGVPGPSQVTDDSARALPCIRHSSSDGGGADCGPTDYLLLLAANRHSNIGSGIGSCIDPDVREGGSFQSHQSPSTAAGVLKRSLEASGVEDGADRGELWVQQSRLNGAGAGSSLVHPGSPGDRISNSCNGGDVAPVGKPRSAEVALTAAGAAVRRPGTLAADGKIGSNGAGAAASAALLLSRHILDNCQHLGTQWPSDERSSQELTRRWLQQQQQQQSEQQQQ